MPEIQPLINGHRYSFASVVLEVNGYLIAGVKSVNYGESLDPGKLWGTGPEKIGRTPGKYDAHLDFEIYRREWDVLRPALAGQGGAYGTVSFDVLVQYHEGRLNFGALSDRLIGPPEEQTVSDRLQGCRITSVEPKNQEGSDASSLVITCDVLRIIWGGERGEVMELVLPDGATSTPRPVAGEV